MSVTRSKGIEGVCSPGGGQPQHGVTKPVDGASTASTGHPGMVPGHPQPHPKDRSMKLSTILRRIANKLDPDEPHQITESKTLPIPDKSFKTSAVLQQSGDVYILRVHLTTNDSVTHVDVARVEIILKQGYTARQFEAGMREIFQHLEDTVFEPMKSDIREQIHRQLCQMGVAANEG